MQHQQEKISQCRVCGGFFYPKPLLRYENMPGAAQYMPDITTLATDQGTDFDVCQCASCGLIQLDSPPVHYYREVVRAAAFSPEMKMFRNTQFRDFISHYTLLGKKVVEVGCGRGEYLALLHENGAEVHGLEFSAESVRHCVNEGYPVFQGFIDNNNDRLPEAPYAAFLILNFLEHLPNPHLTLRGISHNLLEGGVGLVEVPNFDMIVNNGLFSEFIGDHLFYFTEETLTQLLANNGFEVIDCQEIWHNYILSATVRKRSCANLTHLLRFQEKIEQEILQYLDRFGRGRVAIWGAGHQALAIISLLKLQDKIRYVLDSATFKQGKYTPASHLLVVPPDRLRTDPVDAVIVMAASYSDEVAGIIREKYDAAIHVAILRDFGLEIM